VYARVPRAIGDYPINLHSHNGRLKWTDYRVQWFGDGANLRHPDLCAGAVGQQKGRRESAEYE